MDASLPTGKDMRLWNAKGTGEPRSHLELESEKSVERTFVQWPPLRGRLSFPQAIIDS